MLNVGLGVQRKTILLVDDDAQFRASLRQSLEGAGFSVGEAANSQEGERTTLRITPDAILADLLLESVDAGHHFARNLREKGIHIPLYIISTAADALVGAVNYHDLGIAGVFYKPVDTQSVIQTLAMRLGYRLTDRSPENSCSWHEFIECCPTFRAQSPLK